MLCYFPVNNDIVSWATEDILSVLLLLRYVVKIGIIKYFKLMLLSFYVSSEYDIKSLGQKHNMKILKDDKFDHLPCLKSHSKF